MLDENVDQVLKEVCLELAACSQSEWLALGTDQEPVHFRVQSVPSYSPTKILTMRKKQLWGGAFWTDG